eukprot:s9507_g1.t1
MFLTKKKKRQRPALTAKMVAALEKLAADLDAPSLDRVIAGFFVLLVYTRGRFPDGLNMQNLRAEVPASASANSLAGYVEADVSRTKAAYTLERKTMYLPIVAPRHGVTDHDWFSGFLEARQASCVPSGPGIPLLPARSSSSGWVTVPPTAGVAASWLRGTLQSLGFAARDIAPIGTHSCKTTTLSWASKAGLSTATRRALGYHSASDDKMVLVYSRDAMSAPVRELESVIKDVREGRFRPDETRSGFFRSDEELEESGTESSGNEEDDVEDQAHLDEAIDLCVQPWSEVDGAGQAGAPVARHKVSRMIHAIADEAGDRSRSSLVAMSVTDSVPTFKARAAALGLAADVVDLFLDAKVDTLSKYAFCSSYVPGQANESEFIAALKAVMKRDATVGELSCLRRLLHEAYSMSAAELKQVVERTEDMPAKKLAQPERAHRLDTQQKRLTGFRIEGALEPADRLIDLVVQQYEENRVYHVDLHKCPSKEQEVLSQSSKEDRNITIDALGNVRVKGKDAKLEADLASDLLLRNAFTRRALAYDQANLVD